MYLFSIVSVYNWASGIDLLTTTLKLVLNKKGPRNNKKIVSIFGHFLCNS